MILKTNYNTYLNMDLVESLEFSASLPSLDHYHYRPAEITAQASTSHCLFKFDSKNNPEYNNKKIGEKIIEYLWSKKDEKGIFDMETIVKEALGEEYDYTEFMNVFKIFEKQSIS